MSLYAFCTQGANLRQNISTNLTILPTEQDLVNLKGTFRTIMVSISLMFKLYITRKNLKKANRKLFRLLELLGM